MPTRPSPYSWVVLNQSQALAHQQMQARLADALGPCLVCTGTPHPTTTNRLAAEKGPSYDRRDAKRRLATWGAFVAWAAARLARLPGRPFVLVMTNPPFLPHLAWAFRHLRGFRYGLLVWDIYPEHVVEMGWLSPHHPVVGAWRFLNRLALRRAEVVITLSDAMAETLRAQLGDDPRPIEVIPSWADTDAIRPLDKALNPFARAHGQVGKVTVMYSGNMGATHGLESVVEAAAALRDDDRVRFLFVGDGNGRAAVAEGVARHGLDNVALLPYQPWDVLPQSLAAADIAVVSQAPGTEHLSLPSKTYTSLAAGSALLALTSDGSDLARLVRDEDLGLVCARDDAAAVTQALRALLDDPDRLARHRANARAAAVARYGADAVFERLREVLAPHVTPPSGPTDRVESRVMSGSPRRSLLGRLVKRGLDVAGAAAGLALLAPVLGGAAVAVRLSMGSPVLFRQVRPGLDGEPFELRKFRTMRLPRPGEEGPEHDAARLTRVGRFLRATSIDELPTLLNVLRGDMSLVGPRPLLMRYIPRYDARQATRMQVRPGITGLSQVRGRNLLSWEEKLELDAQYVERQSLWLDLEILALTVKTVLAREGVSQEGHATMPEFMGSETPPDAGSS